MQLLNRDNVDIPKRQAVILTGVIEAANETFGGDFDGAGSQSVSVQVFGAYTGTLVCEVSNDGINWLPKQLVGTTGGMADRLTSSAGMLSGDIGARFFRVRASALTAGTPTVILEFSPQSQANLQATQTVTGTVNAGMRPVSSGGSMSTTALAANALFTGTTVDRGTDASAFDTRIKPVVRHLAGLTHGHLVLQESTDGSGWIETRRAPIPSDGQAHTFDWALHYRYWRLLFQNGSAAQTAFHLGQQSSRGDGSSIDTRNVLYFPFTASPLAAGGGFQSAVLDLGANHDWSAVRPFVTTDQTGTLFPQWSDDGSNFKSPSTANGIAVGSNAIPENELRVLARYLRFVYTNGATAQTVFRAGATLVSL